MAEEALHRCWAIRPPRPPTAGLWHYYYLYSLERTGRLTAQRSSASTIGIARAQGYLVRPWNRRLRKSWNGRGHAKTDEDLATSLALLFLSKGRWPVLMAKVQFARHPRTDPDPRPPLESAP